MKHASMKYIKFESLTHCTTEKLDFEGGNTRIVLGGRSFQKEKS